MRRPLLFRLLRDVDESGVSGEGYVADGVRWHDGSATLHWRTEHTSTAVYQSMESLRAIHGHGGKTRVEWADGLNDRTGSPFLRGALHCVLDANENAPFGSTGGLESRESMSAPDYIAEFDRAEYLAGYRDQARAMFGDDWDTCSFGWGPAIEINGSKDGAQ